MKNILTKTRQLTALKNNEAGLRSFGSAIKNRLGGLHLSALPLFFVLVATFAFQQDAQAQFNCSCLNFNLSLGVDGEATVTPSMVSSNDLPIPGSDCYIPNPPIVFGPYPIIVRMLDADNNRLRDSDGNLLALDQVRCNHVGEVIKAELLNVSVPGDTTVICWSFAGIEDKIGPTCVIEDISLDCREYRNPYVERVMEASDLGRIVEPGLLNIQDFEIVPNGNGYGRVTNVEVYVRATVDNIQNLRLQLVHPGGGAMVVDLTNGDAICGGDANIDATFDSGFTKYTCTGGITGTVGPQGDLGQFEGLDKEGSWEISIENFGGANFTFHEITLRVTYDYLPIVTDNCSENPTYSYVDDEDLLCNNRGSILRTWTVTDPGGMTTVCSHEVAIEINTPPTIIWPRDTLLSCIIDIDDLDPNDLTQYNTTGPNRYYDKPQFIGAPDYCGNLASSYDDEIYDICLPYSYKIRRAWKVRDWCDPDFFEDSIQYIIVMDQEVPLITAPDTVKYTVLHNDCDLDINLPEVVMSDNCDTDPTSSVILKDHITGVQLPNNLNVPIGIYDAIYTARDACNNQSWDTIIVIIEDNIEPSPICDRNTNITLTNRGGGADLGWATVCWQTIDDRSYDNCEVDRILISKSGMPGTYSECLTYTCSDVGQNEIFLGVWDKSDNFNFCWGYLFVEDKVAPELTCESDTILCTDDLNRELDRIVAETEQEWMDKGLIVDNCDNTNLICSDFLFEGDDCVPAYIRTCYVEDLNGNQSQPCIHRVEVIDNTPWRVVSFPADQLDLACNSSTDPSRTGEPVLDYDCENIGVRHQDEEFFLCGSTSGLVKIRRTWTVTDWCTGVDVTHLQEIYQKDDVPPSLTIPADFDADINTNDCQVTVPVAVSAVDDCGAPVTITNDYNNQTIQGAGNMVFTLPQGVHEILFRAEDACGNVTVRDLTITVEDRKAPTARCQDISVNLKSTGVVTVQAELLNLGSDDNCTDQANLTFYIQKLDENGDPVGVAGPEITFTCPDQDSTHMVQLVVEDEAGNRSECVTTVRVEDNGDFCIDRSGRFVVVAGTVMTAEGNPIEGANVAVSSGVADVKTSSTGEFMFSAVEKDNEYELVVSMDQNYRDGLNTIDLIHIKRHILQLVRFDSPYKYLAADANNDNKVNTLDMVQLRSLILRLTDELTNSPSWIFLDGGYTFPEFDNPWMEVYPEYVMSEMLYADNMNIEFVGIKVGDIDNSYASSRSNAGSISFNAENKIYKAGDFVEMTVSSDDIQSLIGSQFTLKFNNKALQFESFAAGVMNSANLGTVNAEDGYLTFSWDYFNADFSSNDLFTLTFIAKQDAEFARTVSINSDLTNSEAYDNDGNVFEVELSFNDKTSTEFELYQNNPNPFAQYTSIGFNLPKSDVVSLRIMDVSGKVVFQESASFEKGMNEFNVNGSYLKAGGIYYYHVETSTTTATKKMVYFTK